MNFQIIGMDQRDKIVVVHILGISPLENISNLDRLKEQMKSQMEDMEKDDQKMLQKFMTPLLMTITQAMEMDGPLPLRSNLQTSLILAEEDFQKMDLKLGDFITLEIKKVDRSKLSKESTPLSPQTNVKVL